jgi:hypothetical protein
VHYFIPGDAAFCAQECKSLADEVILCHHSINGQLLKKSLLNGCLFLVGCEIFADL